MKRIFLLFAFLMAALGVSAQSKVAVNGTIVCTENGIKDGVVGAQVELTSLRDTLDKKYALTAIRGVYQFKQVEAGKYRLVTSSLGYQTDTMQITVEKGKPLTVPEWEIEMEKHKIDEVSVVTQAVRTSINGDTISYNAAAFKVLPDADADELLAKLPGLKVDGGTITTQGETVQKILVDGREFFGNDVSTAIKTIPADQIKSVEVFDKLSDEAEFSGIDDGNSYKAINLVTKIKTAIFGKFNAMYAFEPKTNDKTQHYGTVDGNVNFFRKISKTTLRFRANNMDGNSESKAGMGGLNYIAQWGENDKIKLEGSYTFNANNRKNWSWSDRDYFLTDEEIANNPEEIYKRQLSESNSQGKGSSHSFNTRFEWKINERQRFMMRANVSTSDNESNGTSANNYFPVSGDDIMLNNWNLGESDNINTGVNGNYMVRIGEKAGRTFQVNFSANYNTSNSNNENYSEKRVNEDPIQQRSGSNNYGYSLNGGLTYAEPIGSHAQVTMGYNVNYNESDADRLTNLYDFAAGVYDPMINPEYSNSHNTSYLTHRVGPGFRYGNEGTSVSGRLNYQHVTMNSERLYPALYTLPEKTFENFTYSLMGRIKLNMENRLMVRVNSSTSNPSVGQLQDVVDISNVNHISAGNPDLKPSYSHRANLNYNYSGIENGTTFSIGVGGSIAQRSIVSAVIRNSPGYQVMSPDGEYLTTLSPTGQYSKPVNTDGAWNYNGHISYGFPLTFIGCNFNIDANGGVNQSPSLIGRWNGGDEVEWQKNFSKRRTVGGGASISSNFSDYIDFRFAYHPSYSNVTNSTSPDSNREEIHHNINGNVRVVFGFGLTLSANGHYSKTQGLNTLASQLDHENLICNFGIGMKVFKKMGEFQLVANDVFNRNDGFNRSWNSQYMQTSMSSVIGRYFGLKFTYNLRRNTGGGQNNQRGGFDPSMMPPGGMPGGGPGGFGGGMGGPGGGGFGGGRGGF